MGIALSALKLLWTIICIAASALFYTAHGLKNEGDEYSLSVLLLRNAITVLVCLSTRFAIITYAFDASIIVDGFFYLHSEAAEFPPWSMAAKITIVWYFIVLGKWVGVKIWVLEVPLLFKVIALLFGCWEVYQSIYCIRMYCYYWKVRRFEQRIAQNPRPRVTREQAMQALEGSE